MIQNMNLVQQNGLRKPTARKGYRGDLLRGSTLDDLNLTHIQGYTFALNDFNDLQRLCHIAQS